MRIGPGDHADQDAECHGRRTTTELHRNSPGASSV
jgi:hypothetical protein